MLFNPIRLLVSGLITLVVLGFGGYKAMNAFDQAGDALDEANASAGDSDSLLHAAEFRKALDTLHDATNSKDALRITIYPSYISAEMSTGSEKDAQGYKVDRDGDVTKFGITLTGPGELADNVFPVAKVDPAVLDKVIAGAMKRDGSLELDDVSHAIVGIDPVSGKADWKVYFNGSDYWTANLDGSDLRRGGVPAKEIADATKDVQDAADQAQSQADTAVSNAQKVTDCIAKAAGNVAQIQACTK